MGQNGGARPGAGRKRKADKYHGRITEAEDRIADRLPQLIDNLIALADGVEVEEAMPNGGTRIYSRAPDYKANEYLINRIMGKPTERHEIESEGGTIGFFLSRLDGDELNTFETLTRKAMGEDRPGADPGDDPGREVPPEPE